ncbi:MAG: aminotransferase class V-fold PLP-dependent enzyme [Pseudomonadota bacterium]
MTKDLLYLDYAATTPLAPSARAAMERGFDMLGNPSSIHRAGRAARDAINAVRLDLANHFGVTQGQVIFTSGGTEANALALHQVQQERRFASAIEHEAVLAWVPEANHLPVTPNGVLDLEAAEAKLSEAEPGLVSLMAANNATGARQPVEAAAKLAAAHGHLVHCDAVQAFGKIPLDLAALGADFLTVSAHKIGGPKGIGALIVKDGFPLQSLLRGGGQERRRRPGTENLIGILGLGGALETIERYGDMAQFLPLMEQVIAHVGLQNVAAYGAERFPHILSIQMPGIKNQLQLMRFDLDGICVSAGSACSSGKVAGNHVLEAMGYGDRSEEFIRVSFGPETTQGDVARFLAAWDKIQNSAKAAA